MPHFLYLFNILKIIIGWLEPLLDPIARNPNVSTVPIIETIDYVNFALTGSKIDQIQVGGNDFLYLIKFNLNSQKKF